MMLYDKREVYTDIAANTFVSYSETVTPYNMLLRTMLYIHAQSVNSHRQLIVVIQS